MSSTTEGRESHRFSSSVSPNDREESTYTMQEDATIEDVTVRFYPGPQLDLHVTPFVDRQQSNGHARREELVELHGKEYIDGDNDLWKFDVSVEVETDDKIGVAVENDDGTHSYDYVCDMAVEYAGGTSRWPVSWFRRLI